MFYFVFYTIFIVYFLFIILIIYFLSRSAKQQLYLFNDNTPFISVIITVRNEENNIERLITQLKNQKYPHFEIIIVNDHSTDNTVELIEKYKDERITLIHLSNNEIGKKQALKHGIYKAKGEWIVTTDADTFIQREWLATLAKYFFKDYIFTGLVFLKPVKNTFFHTFQYLDHTAMQIITLSTTIAGLPFLCSGANLALERKNAHHLINDIKSNIPSGDDIFLLHAAIKNKLKVITSTESPSFIETNTTETLNSFYLQRIRWASKAKYYTNKTAIVISLIIYLFNVFFTLFVLWNFLNTSDFQSVFIMILIKLLIEGYLFITANRILRLKPIWKKYFIFVFIVYPFYISIIGTLSFFTKIKWKNRTWY